MSSVICRRYRVSVVNHFNVDVAADDTIDSMANKKKKWIKNTVYLTTHMTNKHTIFTPIMDYYLPLIQFVQFRPLVVEVSMAAVERHDTRMMFAIFLILYHSV